MQPLKIPSGSRRSILALVLAVAMTAVSLATAPASAQRAVQADTPEVDTYALWEEHNQRIADQLFGGGPDFAGQVIGGNTISTPSWYVWMGNCGATLVAPQWILSAEHCGNPSNGRFLEIGGVESRRAVGYWDLANGPRGYEDISLIKLERPASLPPLEMSNNGALDDAGRWVQGIGRGQDCHPGCGAGGPVKTTGWVTVTDSDAGFNNHAFNFGRSGATVCFGDSGGPVVGDANPPNAQLILVGAVSYTINEPTSCSNRGGAAKVAQNYGWAWSIINSNGGPGTPDQPAPPPPDPEPGPGPGPAPDCSYVLTNDSSETLWFIENFGRGVAFPSRELPAGSSVTYDITEAEFEPGQSWLELSTEPWPAGETLELLIGPCGTEFTYGGDPDPEPQPDPQPQPEPEPEPDPAPGECTYVVSNGSGRLVRVWAYLDGGLVYLDRIPAGGVAPSVMPVGFNPGSPDFDIVGLYYVEADGSYTPTGFSSSDVCGSSLTFVPPDPGPAPQPDPQPQPDPGPAPQPDPGPGVAGVGGLVTNQSGAPVGGVLADLFASNQLGERLGYLSSVQTGSDGGYSFGVDVGCYAVTLSAPSGSRFANGSRWANVSACVTSGETVDSLDAVLADAGNTATLGDSVTYVDGSPVVGVGVDLFTAAGDGSRGEYMRSAESDTSGGYGFTVAPGCYVVTFVAPVGEQFTNGSQWLNSSVCVQAGEANDSVDAVVSGGGDMATVTGAVLRGGGGVGDVAIDVFTTAADGSRGDWVSQVRTEGSGGFSTLVPGGCYTLTFIAPDGSSFTNGSQWFNRSFCVEAGGAAGGNTAQLL